MNEVKKNKINRFLKDEVMSNAVYEVLRDSFLSKKNNVDVQYLAAERIALNLLQDSWKELLKYKSDEDNLSPPSRQIGL